MGRFRNRVVRCLALASLCAGGFSAPAQSNVSPLLSAAPGAPVNEPVVAAFEYRKTGFSLLGTSLASTTRNAAFKKEPQLTGTPIRRGQFTLPKSTRAVAFLWDCTQGKLYLDLNANEDFTDDPKGEFSCPRQEMISTRDYFSGSFSGVPLSLQVDGREIPWEVTLDFTHYRSSTWVRAGVHNYWSAQVRLGGKDFEVGWIPNPMSRSRTLPDYVLVRPWADRGKSFQVSGGALDAFAIPEKLFVAGAAYQVALSHPAQGAQVKHQITFQEQRLPMGEVAISGKYIKRLVLVDGPCSAVIDAPSGSVRVPAGRYGSFRVELNSSSGSTAYLEDASVPGAINVKAGESVAVFAGGPLTNSARLTPNDDRLTLDYELLGAGGHKYQLASSDYANPPRFKVFRGDRQVAAGKFEYG